MNYNELKKILTGKKISIGSFCEQLDYTRQGLQKCLNADNLPSNKVSELCRLLGITPNEFFGWPVGEGGVVASNIGGDNQQNAGLVIEVLAGQLREKDKQIAQLLKALGR